MGRIPPEQVDTERLILRRFNRRDVSSLEEGVRSSLADLNEWLPWAHMDYTRDDAVAFVRDSIQAWKEEKAFDYAIRLRDDPERHIGNISIWQTSRTGKIGEIGYWVRTDLTRQGLATEATRAIMRVGFQHMGLHKITLRIAVGNRGSERVAEKLGFTREGVLREELLIRGNWVDHTLYSMLEGEFRRVRGGSLR
ncbi:MAG TPA: GNAT family protein [Acidimicrobiia bacterium]|jgi:RimJ/RimL family protein N-acetyltransferase|nr:GNAT family protein [Acidimicrobiia bacterium]